MRNRALQAAVVGALTLAVLLPTAAIAGEPFARLKLHHGYGCQTSPPCVSPMGVSVGPPGPYRYPGYSAYAPWYGYGFGVPTFSWGYFGATYRPAVICHRGYYGDFSQWSYRLGY